jgi:hypothetical protein
MGDILKTLVATPVSLILLIAGIAFFFIAAGGKITGKIEPDKTGRFISVIIGTFLLVLSFGVGNPIPPGSYQGTCTHPQVKDETLIATCKTFQQQYKPAELPGFKNCKGDISNENGQLVCSK